MKPGQHVRLAAAEPNQMKDMHGAALADSIDPANALLESHRIPRQFQIDDETARLLEIEPFAAGIRREQETAAAARELFDGRKPFVAGHSPVKRHGRGPKRCLDVQQRVAILREHNRWFVYAPKKPRQRGDLRLVSCRPGGGVGERAEESALVRSILKAEERRPVWRFVGWRQFARKVAERELELARGQYFL